MYFRTLTPYFQSLQERLNLLVRTDIRLLETCDLRLNGLFFPKYILVLFIGYKTDLMSDPAKSEIRVVLTQEQTEAAGGTV